MGLGRERLSERLGGGFRLSCDRCGQPVMLSFAHWAGGRRPQLYEPDTFEPHDCVPRAAPTEPPEAAEVSIRRAGPPAAVAGRGGQPGAPAGRPRGVRIPRPPAADEPPPRASAPRGKTRIRRAADVGLDG